MFGLRQVFHVKCELNLLSKTETVYATIVQMLKLYRSQLSCHSVTHNISNVQQKFGIYLFTRCCADDIVPYETLLLGPVFTVRLHVAILSVHLSVRCVYCDKVNDALQIF